MSMQHDKKIAIMQVAVRYQANEIAVSGGQQA